MKKTTFGIMNGNEDHGWQHIAQLSFGCRLVQCSAERGRRSNQIWSIGFRAL